MNRPDDLGTSMPAAAAIGHVEHIDVPPYSHAAHGRPLSSPGKRLFRLIALSFSLACLPRLEMASIWMGAGKDLGLPISAETNRADLCSVNLVNHDVAKRIAAKLAQQQQQPFDQATDVSLQFEGECSGFWQSIAELSPEEAEVLLNLLNLSLVKMQADVFRPLALSYEGDEM